MGSIHRAVWRTAEQRLCSKDQMMWSRVETLSVLGSVVILLLLLQPSNSAPGHCIHNYYNCKYGDNHNELSREGRNVLNGGRISGSSIYLTVMSAILTGIFMPRHP